MIDICLDIYYFSVSYYQFILLSKNHTCYIEIYYSVVQI